MDQERRRRRRDGKGWLCRSVRSSCAAILAEARKSLRKAANKCPIALPLFQLRIRSRICTIVLHAENTNLDDPSNAGHSYYYSCGRPRRAVAHSCEFPCDKVCKCFRVGHIKREGYYQFGEGERRRGGGLLSRAWYAIEISRDRAVARLSFRVCQSEM